MPSEVVLEDRGVYTKDEIDTYTFGDIEKAKNTFLINLNSIDIYDAIQQLKRLIGLMDSIVYKYVGRDNPDKVNKETILLGGNPYNFYQLKKIAYSKTINWDYDKLSLLVENTFKVYNILIKPYISLPTTRLDPKKKFLEKLYSIAYKEADFVGLFVERYHKACSITGLPRCARTFYTFSLSEMPIYDLDSHNDIAGFARIGKSMATIEFMREIYQFRFKFNQAQATKYIIQNNILATDVIYNDTTPFISRIRETEKRVYIGDESYFIADKREAMFNRQVEMSHIVNAYANKNHTFFMLIQNLADMDTRFTNKANTILLLTERGFGFVLAKEKHYPLMKDQYDLGIFHKKPYLLSNKTKGDYNIKKLPSYCFKIKWDNMPNDPLWLEYKKQKELAQAKYKTFTERYNQAMQKYGNQAPEQKQDINTYLAQRAAKDPNQLPPFL